MSLVDEARDVRERIAARLRELEPLVAEYNELQKVAAEMGIHAIEPGSASTTETPRRERPNGTRRPRAAKRAGKAAPPAPSASRNDRLARRVLKAVRDEPGKTVAEYAAVLALSPTTLYRPTRELTAAGAIVKRGRQLFPG